MERPIVCSWYKLKGRWISEACLALGLGLRMKEWERVLYRIPYLIREIKTENRTLRKPKTLFGVAAMDFQVVVLGGGLSKKLLPLVSQVSNSNASNQTNFDAILLFWSAYFCLQELPNALLPVANRPVLSYVLEYLELSNLKDLIVVFSFLAIF